MKTKKISFLFYIVSIILLFQCKKDIRKEFLKEESNIEIERLKKISTKKGKEGAYKTAIIYSKKLLELSFQTKDTSEIAYAFYKIGLYNLKDNKIDSAYNNYLKSIDWYLKINDSIKIAKRLLSLSKIVSNYGDYLKSDSLGIKALKFLKNKSNKIKSSIYGTLGINSNEQGNYLEAIDYFNSAIITTTDSLRKVRYKNNKANNYINIGNYQKSIEIYKEIVNGKYFNDSIPLQLKAKIIDTYAYAKFLNKEELTEDNFLKAQRIKKEIKNYLGLVTNYGYLSSFYSKKNKQKSLDYAYKMYYLSKEIKSPKETILALDKIIEIESPNKIRKLAFERFNLSDSIQLAKQKSRNKFAKISYNYEEERRQKLKAKAELADSRFILAEQKSQKQLWIFIGFISFFGFISYVFYKRNKTKREKIIEVYKTETRLAKKIHDELANDMYLAMNKLQKEEREDTSILYDLEKIYSLTRNISHENSPVVTGELFEDFLKQLFVDFTTDTCKIMNKGLSDVKVNDLRKEKQIVLYRLLQELLVNMTKHSQASLAVISFSLQKDTIQVQYKDNGIGTNTVTIKNGLKNMETRIKSIGGTIIFESENEKGFKSKFQFKK